MATVMCSAGARATLSVPRKLAVAAMTTRRRRRPLSFLSTRRSYSISETGFSPPRLRSTAPARKSQGLMIRAARTESQGVSLGFRAPHFEKIWIDPQFWVIVEEIPEIFMKRFPTNFKTRGVCLNLPEPLTGKVWTLEDFESHPALLVMFICNHCPFVKHLKKDVVKLANFYAKKGLAVVAISSNSVATHPQDGPEYMAEEAKLFNYPFPYLYDESQDVARDFGAVCTPEFFLFKKDGRRPFELVYHGQFDDSRPSNNLPITGRDICLAIECVLSGQPVPSNQKPSVGCSIKWDPQTNQ